MSFERMWEILRDEVGVSEEAISLVTTINGNTAEALESILYAVTAYRSFDQYEDEEGN